MGSAFEAVSDSVKKGAIEAEDGDESLVGCATGRGQKATVGRECGAEIVPRFRGDTVDLAAG